MQVTEVDVLIIGAGLTGMSLGFYLREEDLNIHIVEGRNRLGGRIHTVRSDNSPPIEMGATWFGKKHQYLIALLNELNIEAFEQRLGDRAIYEAISTSPPQLVQLPPNEDPSYRIQKGTSSIIETLARQIDPADISLNEKVEGIIDSEDHILVHTTKRQIRARKVVSTLPPYLLTHSIDCKPELPSELRSISSACHTWMGDSIKIALTYAAPFWRHDKMSGTIFSNVGPIPEMYDHSNCEETHFALVGFLNSAYFSTSKEERRSIVLQQLKKYYGGLTDTYLSYEETVWRHEPFTFSKYSSHIIPHQNNGHHFFRKNYWDQKLFIAGSETAEQYPGYMDGAVNSARFIAKQLTGLS
jgi:monoamine oxidase